MRKRLLSSVDGVDRYHYFDEANDKTIIQTTQDVEPIFDLNKRALANSDPGWKGDWHYVAAIPKVILEQWWAELGDDPFHERNKIWLFAKLNDRDFSKVRTKEGRL
jgi:hypothetical protein